MAAVSTCVVVPALDAEATLGDVLTGLAALELPVFVVDDGSKDGTARVAREAGARVERHERNRGKGAAIRTGLRAARAAGFARALTVDADGQHPASAALRVLDAAGEADALVLGVRDLRRDGAPGANRFGNDVSNFFLSAFSGRRLRDTQCGLRLYPIDRVLALGCRADGFAFEAEVVLRALAARLPVTEVSVEVIYPPAGERRTHFRKVADPTRIVFTVVRTVLALRLGR